ncbi:MAG: hypothetical protein C4293_07705 [Nitrospiraceae bacterium]
MLLVARTVIGLGFLLILGSCASSTREIPLHESPEGTVYLERVADRDFQAAHPISLNPTVIARVLSGVMVTDEKTAAQALFASEVRPVRVFSDDDIAFLAPLIASAFERAEPEQRIGFRIIHVADPLSRSSQSGAGVGSSMPAVTGRQTETTSGTLYVHGLSLHLTLTQYRHRPVRPDSISGPNRYYPDSTGLDRRDVLFVPEAARRPDSYQQSGLFSQSNPSTLVIDYQYLAKLGNGHAPANPPVSLSEKPFPPKEQKASPAPAASNTDRPIEKASETNEELRSLKDLVIQKDMELEELKKELRSLRRQLAEREAQMESSKRKSKPVPRSQEPAP